MLSEERAACVKIACAQQARGGWHGHGSYDALSCARRTNVWSKTRIPLEHYAPEEEEKKP